MKGCATLVRGARKSAFLGNGIITDISQAVGGQRLAYTLLQKIAKCYGMMNLSKL